METIVTFAIPILLGILLLKLLLTPMKWIVKLAIHALAGFICLWLLNSVSGFTGIVLPVNTVTVLLSGTLGVPGIILVILMELF